MVPLVPGDRREIYSLLPGDRIYGPNVCGLCTLEELCAQRLSAAQSAWDAHQLSAA
jgi:hypothetical protein